MMLSPNRKKSITVIMGHMGKDPHMDKGGFVDRAIEPRIPEGMPSDNSSHLEHMVSDIMAAFKSGDTKKATSALKAFFYECDVAEDAMEEAGEPEEYMEE